MESRDHSDMLCNIVSGILIATLFSGLQYRGGDTDFRKYCMEGESGV
jgi:hypothetical protein